MSTGTLNCTVLDLSRYRYFLTWTDACNHDFFLLNFFKSLLPARTPAPQDCLQQVRKAGEADLQYPALHLCEEADPERDGARTLQDLQPLLLHHLNRRQFTLVFRTPDGSDRVRLMLQGSESGENGSDTFFGIRISNNNKCFKYFCIIKMVKFVLNIQPLILITVRTFTLV
jgi:hypothetical protein